MSQSGVSAGGNFCFKKAPESCLELLDYLQRVLNQTWKLVRSTAVDEPTSTSRAEQAMKEQDPGMHEGLFGKQFSMRYPLLVEKFRQISFPLKTLFKDLGLPDPPRQVFKGPVYEFYPPPDKDSRAWTYPARDYGNSLDFWLPELERQGSPADGHPREVCFRNLLDFQKFWRDLMKEVHTAALDREELPPWMPSYALAWTSWNETETIERYPPFPIKSPEDLAAWLQQWSERFTKPPRPSQGPIPEFPKLSEEHSWCPTENDISRELLNCRRTLLKLQISDWPRLVEIPPKMETAERDVLTLIAWMQDLHAGDRLQENEGARPAISNEEKAIAVLVKDMTLSIAQIAKKVGVHRTTLYKYEKFKLLWERFGNSPGRQPPRGSKDRDGNLEAVDDSEPEDGLE